jgi:hypothetical protein
MISAKRDVVRSRGRVVLDEKELVRERGEQPIRRRSSHDSDNGDGEARCREDVKKKDDWEVWHETVTFHRIVLEREWISVTSGGCGRETLVVTCPRFCRPQLRHSGAFVPPPYVLAKKYVRSPSVYKRMSWILSKV